MSDETVVVPAEAAPEAPAVHVGVSETKDVVLLAVDTTNALIAIFKDKKLSVEDVGTALTLVPSVAKALDGIAKLPAELKDLDAAEAAEIVAAVGAKLALDNAKAGLVVEKSLKVCLAVADLVLAVKA